MNISLRKNTKYCFIRSALAKKYDKAALADILRRAESHYATLAAQCADALPGEQFHLDNTILPTAAIYKALLEADRTNALAVTHEALMPTFCESWLSFLDMVSEGLLMPLCGICTCLMMGWEVKPEFVRAEVETAGNRFTAYRFYRFCVRYVTPLIMLFILYGQLKDFFNL
jgi:hypothetical protein